MDLVLSSRCESNLRGFCAFLAFLMRFLDYRSERELIVLKFRHVEKISKSFKL